MVEDSATLPPLPSPEIPGGASVLRLQAACGFRAFAEIRLRAASPQARELGLSAAERGSLAHRALEAFWSRTSSRAELSALSSADRHARIDEAVDTAFLAFPLPSATEPWTAAFLSVQRDRLRRLLSSWLHHELQRGPFTVLSREAKDFVTVGPLRLEIRPDRIDQVDEGRVLVDYKTGSSAHPANWMGDRPDDPQLPLYALLTPPEELKALLFARLRPGKDMKWMGLEADARILPPNRTTTVTDLSTSLGEWRTVLSSLAEDFASGHAEARPKNYPLNCRYCGQRLLCRLDPSTLLDSSLEDVDDPLEAGEDALA
jgi:RecB family exonuclease